MLRNLLHNWKTISLRLIAYVYLYGAFAYMTIYASFGIRTAARPIGLLLGSASTILMYVLYCIVNHTLIRRIIKQGSLIIFEILLLVTLFCLYIADIKTEKFFYG